MAKIDTSTPTLLALLNEDRDKALAYVAEQLRSDPNEDFLAALSEMFDATHPQWRIDVVGKSGRRDAKFWEAAHYMMVAVDIDNRRVDDALADVERDYGLRRSAALKGLLIAD